MEYVWIEQREMKNSNIKGEKIERFLHQISFKSETFKDMFSESFETFLMSAYERQYFVQLNWIRPGS